MTVAHVDTAALIEAVRRVSLVAERNTPVRLSFSEAMVTLEAGSGDEAQATESLEATVDGDDISIGFNPSYLLDGLGALDAPVHILRSPSRPGRRRSPAQPATGRVPISTSATC